MHEDVFFMFQKKKQYHHVLLKGEKNSSGITLFRQKKNVKCTRNGFCIERKYV